jgi:dihydropteroate synthase
VWEGDEIERIVPVIEKLSRTGAAISVDTRRVGVFEAALAAGGHLWNDVSGLRHDPRSREFAAHSGAPVCIMHAPGKGDDLHDDGIYQDVVLDVFDWLKVSAMRPRRQAWRGTGSCSTPASALARRCRKTSR